MASPTAKSDQGMVQVERRLPHLKDYTMNVSWAVYFSAFVTSAGRQIGCNYLTASGITGESAVLNSATKGMATFGIMLAAFWAAASLMGTRYRSPIIVFFTVWASLIYAVVFHFRSSLASLTMLPNVLLALIVCTPFSKKSRWGFALVVMMLTLCLQVMLTFIVNALPLVQSNMPQASRQFLVPVLKTFYLGFVTEVLTLSWRRLYKMPCTPFIFNLMLMMALVSAESMGVVGLLAAVDSEDIWGNAAIFCATNIVMETNSRAGILISLLYKLCGKKYRFSDAAHLFRWGKMWVSYCWMSPFTSFVVPALIAGLEVEGSNFNFLRWEPWVLVFIYVVQQVMTDVIYIYTQHYVRPMATVSQTAARCLVLGEATPFSGENEHIGKGGTVPKDPVEEVEEFETASVTIGRWTISGEWLLVFFFFEFTLSVFNNYVRGQFCIYGTFLPTEDGSCD